MATRVGTNPSIILLATALGCIAVTAPVSAMDEVYPNADSVGCTPGEFVAPGEPIVTFSYDDAYANQLTYAVPQLEAAGFRGTFNLYTEEVTRQGAWPLWAAAIVA